MGYSIDNPRGKMTLKNFDYEIAIHTVKIQRSGQAINIDEMKEVLFISSSNSEI